MPVFGKASKARSRTREKRRQFIEKAIYRERGSKRRYYGERVKWGVENSSMEKIETMLPLIFEEGNFIEERFRQKKKPVVVLDWGCGNGLAIKQFAKKYGKKIRAYGFAKDSYKEWLKTRSVKFIHATANDLLRYLKDDSVDLVYSYLGLRFMFGTTSKSAMQKGISYTKKLLKKIKPGGKIVLYMPISEEGENRFILASLRKKAHVLSYAGAVYITKPVQRT